MSRKKSQKFNNLNIILMGVILGLVAILAALMIDRFQQSDSVANAGSLGPRVSLGAMQYDFSGEKAVKRDDKTVRELEAFLVSLSEKDDRHNCESYYNVVMESSDESQVLLSYGCPYPSASMFAVNDGDGWRTISPTNKFDIFGIPECDYVSEHKIEKTLAPVCVENHRDMNTPTTYSVR